METKFLHPGHSQEKIHDNKPGVTEHPESREKTVNDELAAGNAGRSTSSDRNIVNDDLAM